MERAVVVLSGGQDSATCLLWALNTFDSVHAVSFDYGQRHVTELQQAKKIAEDFHVPHYIMDMSLLQQLAPNALTQEQITIEYKEGDDIPTTFVPGRNLVFLSFAAIYAYHIAAQHLVTGVGETDFSGYPDCRDAFIKSLNVTLGLGLNKDVVIHTPLMWLNKAETWKLADDMGHLDYIRENTVTCYYGKRGDGCRECPACVLRNEGLVQYLEKKEEIQ